MDYINKKIMIFSSAKELFQFAANDFKTRVLDILKHNKTVSIALSGGNTPKVFYDALTDQDDIHFPWDKLKFFFGDERYVPHTDPASNYYTANQHLFAKLSIPSQNIFAIPTHFKDPLDAAIDYEHTLKNQLTYKNGLPYFDFIYLGLGDDGHTASLMPHSNIVLNYIKYPLKSKLVEAEYIDHLKMYRVTFMPSLINNAGTVIFLITGSSKDHAVQHVLTGDKEPFQYPAQLIHCNNGETMWYLDSLAARYLKES